MKLNTMQVFEHGYIVLPKVALKAHLASKRRIPGDLEAILILLMHVNYSDTVYDIHHKEVCCHRGEAVYNFTQWARFFGWTRPRTVRFFTRMRKEGIIRLISEQQSILHICVVDYDIWTGQNRLAREQKQTLYEQEFLEFWEKYHNTLHVKRRNIGRAQSEWRKLSDEDRRLAIQHIEDFYYSVEDVRFIPQASTYLADKAFLNDFGY